jgi:hypothetical protein
MVCGWPSQHVTAALLTYTGVSDPDSIRPVDPDPHLESGSGSRRAKMTHKGRKIIKKFHVLKCWMFSFESLRLLL